MSIVRRYLLHPHLVLALVILGVVLGIKSFRELPLNLFPDANYPKIVVIIEYPGASAEDIEREIAIPVEKEMSTLSLVRKVRSVARDGTAVISVEFEYEKELSAAEVDVAAALDRVKSKLPDGMLPPRIFKVSDASFPVMTIAVYPKKDSELSLSDTRRLVEEYVKPELLNVSEIGDVDVFGGDIPEILVEVDRDKLAKYGISLADVVYAVSAQNSNLPMGVIRTNKREIYIKFPGEAVNPGELGNVVINLKDGGNIHLTDIAKVVLYQADRHSLFHGDGRPAVGVNILRPEGGNVMAAIRAAKTALKQIFARFPQLEYRIVDTQEELIKTSVSNLMDALRDAVVLTVLVIFLLMARVRATFLTAVSIPVTYFLTFFLMHLLGMELNIVTMTAVILAVGLLVDDSIVVAENIERHIRELGLSSKEAAISGTEEIILADLSGTLTTILVLIPIMFIGGYVEKILRQLALVLTLALASSYLVSVTVIPLMAPYLLRTSSRNRIERLLERVNAFLLGRLQRFYIFLFRLGVKHWFLLVLPALLLFLVSVRKVMPLVGKDLMPPMDTGILKVSFEFAPNTPVEEAEKTITKIEDRIKRIPGLIRMATVVGSEPDAISFGAERAPGQGIITAHLVDRFHRKKSIWEIEDELYRSFLQIPGLKNIHVYEYGATPLSSIAAPVDVMISGGNPRILHRLGEAACKLLFKVRGLASVSKSWDFDKMEYLITPNFEKLSRYGISVSDVTKSLNSALFGVRASFWRVPEESPYTVRVRFPESQRFSINEALNTFIKTREGPVPLREFVRVKSAFVRPFIVRQNLTPVIDVFGYRRKAAITHIQTGVKRELTKLRVPEGYSVHYEGEIKQMKESFERLKKALILSLILLYFSLVPTFRSFRHPLTIMVAIPLSLIGAIWALFIAGRHFCMPASMGMILLSGVVVNNSILLIDFIERARSEGRELFEAVEESIKARTRPILMTALSTIVGMLPIAAERAIGLERLSPLATVASGGLLVGTVLTLVYVPVLYVALEKIKAFFHNFSKSF